MKGDFNKDSKDSKDSEDASTESSQKILIFRAADEYFSIWLTNISSIGGEVTATKLPQMPSFIEGILTIRGAMFPAVHLAKRLQLEILTKTELTRYIIIKRQEGQLALIVDEIVGIIKFESSKMQAVPEYLQRTSHAPYIRGIFESERGVTSFLDLKILFSKEQIDELLNFEQIRELHKKQQGPDQSKKKNEKTQKIEQIKNLIKTKLSSNAPLDDKKDLKRG